MYRHLLITRLFLLLAGSGFAQTPIVIYDSHTHAPIPYVVVYAKGKGTPVFTTADSAARFSPRVFSDTDTLVLQCIGYKKAELLVSQLADTIYLQPQAYDMQEVTISATASKRVDNFTNKGTVRFIGDTPGIERVTRLDFPTDVAGATKAIDKVYIKMKIKEAGNPCRLHIYDVSPDGKPGNELLKRSIIISKDDIKGRVCTKDISAEKVFVTGNAVFIGLEFIGEVYSVNKTIYADNYNELKKTIVYKTDQYTEANMYTRTVFYKDWVHIDKTNLTISDNPINMQIGVSYR